MNDDALIPPIYRAPYGTPLYWADESTGELRAAVAAFLDPAAKGPPTGAQLALLRAYMIHHIHAPVWLNNPYATADYCVAIGMLQEQAHAIRTIEDLRAYLAATLDFGLDPL